MIVKYNKEIEISSLSTFKNPPNCPELSAPINFRRPHGMADTDDKVYRGRGGRGYMYLSFSLLLETELFFKEKNYLSLHVISESPVWVKVVPLMKLILLKVFLQLNFIFTLPVKKLVSTGHLLMPTPANRTKNAKTN